MSTETDEFKAVKRCEDVCREMLEKHESKSNLKGDLIKITVALIPFIIGFFIFLSNFNTRLTLVEKNVPSKVEMKDAISQGIKESMMPILHTIKTNQEEIINIRIRLGENNDSR